MRQNALACSNMRPATIAKLQGVSQTTALRQHCHQTAPKGIPRPRCINLTNGWRLRNQDITLRIQREATRCTQGHY